MYTGEKKKDFSLKVRKAKTLYYKGFSKTVFLLGRSMSDFRV